MPSFDPVRDFHPAVRGWFARTFEQPTPPQILGWPSIASGQNTLLLAPTGSGKTLAAFLWAVNHLVEQHLREDLIPGVRILYVSPLKALNNDIERNLQAPLLGIQEEARRLGIRVPNIRVSVRTGDTPQSRRVSMVKHPPDILITTPESLYLMLTSPAARKMFSTVQYLIVDEIHSLCGNKRGVHLSVSLERLQLIALQDPVRIGLSATQRPLELVSAFLGGLRWEDGRLVPRPVTIVDAGRKKEMDLLVECAVPDFSLLPQQGVWPMIFADLLAHIRAHRTTLVFVNNRRLAERVASKLNQMVAEPSAPEITNLFAVPVPTDPLAAATGSAGGETELPTAPLVQAYHGSMSRAARERMEADLKAGKLRALVATSSLELGIDIGSIDLVVQLQSPKSVTSGLQRVGRSGHLVSATSRGRIFPTHREDLVECAVVARAMKEHDVEETSIPENCLDVLAQQVIAMVSVENWDADALFAFMRQSYCYRNLARQLYDNVLQMVAGRYADEAFRGLRPRVSWDKIQNRLLALPGSRHVAVTSGGTITDRGLYGVYLADGKTKLGEVDEEFVYETRLGDTFLLGSNVWRVTAMDTNRLTVEGAPGQPARMPFWRGEAVGRNVQLGTSVGAFRRELAARLDTDDCLAWIRREYPIDSRAAWNILEYFRKQRETTGVIPHDRLLLVEGFRDEIGDPRIVIHSAFGRRINALLGLVLGRLLHQSTGVEPETFTNDDGVLLRCPDVDTLPLSFFSELTTGTAETAVMEDLLASPLFGGQFRQNAARALLLPRTTPGKRTPLWLQRLRAKDLLEISRQFDDFPIVIETVRELLTDVLDYAAFMKVLGGIESGTIGIHTTHTEVPSPFSASLLFDFMSVYMYEWDTPRTDTLSRYLSVNRELLSEIVDLDSVGSMIRPEAIEKVEQQLQHVADGHRARSPEELMEILLRIGDLSEEEILVRCEGNGRAMLEVLARDGRATRVDLPGGVRWIAGEDRKIYRNLRDENHIRWIVQRYLQHHGPTTSREVAHRYGMERAEVDRAFADLTSGGTVIRGRFRPPPLPETEVPQWCYRTTMERIQRQTLFILRKEINPCSMEHFTQFLLHWQHVHPDSRLDGTEATRTVLDQLQGLPLPAEIWERDVVRGRVRGFQPDFLDRETSAGAAVWVGAGAGKIMVIPRGAGHLFLPEKPSEPQRRTGEAARRVLAYLEQHGASFLSDIRTGCGLSLRALNSGIGELFWDGFITNDVYGELSKIPRPSRIEHEGSLEPVAMVHPGRNPERMRLVQSARRAIRQVPGWTGRWSLARAPGVMGDETDLEGQAAAQARQLLERYGVLARELFRREALLPWPIIAAELQRMEMRGEVRRGYFVSGLSGMQYALPAAVDEIRRHRQGTGRTPALLLLNACDPANPFGTGIELPSPTRGGERVRLLRQPSHYLVLREGMPLLLMEGLGNRIWSFGEPDTEAFTFGVQAMKELLRLPARLKPAKVIRIEYINGERPTESPQLLLLQNAGFRRDRDQTLTFDGYP